MIWTMIVYFFAVIGVVALAHFLIGWLFVHADYGGSNERAHSLMYAIKEMDEKIIENHGPPSFEMIDKQVEYEKEMTAHLRAHNK